MTQPLSDRELRPCDGCGWRIRGGNLCRVCQEYGAPVGWRWEWDSLIEKHVRAALQEGSAE